VVNVELRPAALAFDAIAPAFDARFGAWASVSAQRRAVRTALMQEFAPGARLLEIGGGTGEDASFLAARGYRVHLTDPSPAMVQQAALKLAVFGCNAQVVAGEEFGAFAEQRARAHLELFDGAFSNFAPLNCVVDLQGFAQGMAQLLRPGAAAMLVLFGTFCPGEMLVETLRLRPRSVFRRFKRGAISARLAKREFHIVYHRKKDVARAFEPWFTLERRIGIGVAVPPSAAEPWISERPRLLSALERADRVLGRSLPVFGDHILYQLRRRG
jgi:SAM-dependent methyltransferase